jgi:hypothetical protein
MKKTMTEKRQPSWLRSITEAAKEQGVPLPPFTGHEMGHVRTESTASGRFVTIKRRFVSATEAANDGVEVTLWRTQDDRPLPVVTFREPLRPDQERIAEVLSILKRWLVDEATLDGAISAVGKRGREGTSLDHPGRESQSSPVATAPPVGVLIVRREPLTALTRKRDRHWSPSLGKQTG